MAADNSGYARCLLDEFSACGDAWYACGPGLVCEDVNSGGDRCHTELFVQGQIFDAQSLEPIEGAQILAFSDHAGAYEAVLSDASGMYRFPITARRDDHGLPVQQLITLHVSAPDYQSFPGGLRTAERIDLSTVVLYADEGTLTVDTAQTDVALLALPESEQGFASISGRIDRLRWPSGVLVVAESPTTRGLTAITDRDGAFTIFNVPPGSYEVHGYAAGIQLDPWPVFMEQVPYGGVRLRESESEEELHTVSGHMNFIAASGALQSSVALVPASTYDEVMMRGEVPIGLSAAASDRFDQSGNWTIGGVPAGDYIVLAAFQNDGFVRGPYDDILGNQLVRISIPEGEGNVEVSPAFRVTDALDTIAPGAEGPEALAAPPTLTWGPARNVEHYDVMVFDAHGKLVWEALDIAPGEEGDYLSVAYDGPFQPGMYYQFRVTAYRSGSRVTSTEALRGVFYRE
ncbi:carboxypeptidase-like regulatory domain-containing protein [Lujinxingia litoralis]|uniref:carboxypeptidase-like regulatory domain-containing protein n=1 Tax=Lujinxingia litoralis TaxID=2211119 RepID=UPI0011B93859|nr:carboxypeptidase-like regulatory domain-containing protein [Lujinxingia litoralis]